MDKFWRQIWRYWKKYTKVAEKFHEIKCYQKLIIYYKIYIKIYVISETFILTSEIVFLLQAVIWPALPLVVKQSMLGTAMGVNNSVQMLGVGIANLGVGEILGKNNR